MGADGRFVVEMLNEQDHKERIAECIRLRAEVEALRKDAERYRWLADNCADEYGEAERKACDVVLVWSAPYSKAWRADLDAAIDAAMAPNA
jgi:hypothetical protein